MKKILALALSLVVNTAALASLQSVGTPRIPHGEVYITEIAVSPAPVAHVKLSRWRRYGWCV